MQQLFIFDCSLSKEKRLFSIYLKCLLATQQPIAGIVNLIVLSIDNKNRLLMHL